MKKTYIFIIAAVLLTALQPSKAQWTQVISPTTKSLSAVYFIDENTGFVTGDLPGILFKTTNGGAFYSAINSHTDEIINSIYFINSSTGFTAGDRNKIARSTNGGNNWSVVNSGNTTLHSIHFPNNSRGYAVGGTSIYRTTNGGVTWNQLAYTPGAYLKGVFFTSASIGYICGSNGAIYKTTTGGSSWSQQTSTVTGFLEEISFINAQTGFAVGQNGTILKTIDGGNVWTNQSTIASGWYKSLSLKILNSYSAITGWTCGNDGKILRSTNNGNVWHNQTSGVTSNLNDIYFVNVNTGYAVGAEGVILKTTNGGGGPTTSGIFEKIVSGQLVNELTSSNYSAWGDYDNDGFQDVVISQFNDNCYTCQLPFLLFRNNGNGTFTRITNNAIANSTIAGSGLAWGDYNNDGHLDLFATGTVNSKNILFKNEGNGNFTKITTGDIVNDIAWSQSCSWADYNKDGWLDLFVANRDAQSNFLYKNNGNGTFTKITSGSIVNDIGASRSCAWGDYNNDGWIDLFVINFEAQNNFLYKNNGNGTFTRILDAPMANDDQWGSACGWIDFDNDGNLDLYISNLNGINKLYYNHGNGNFTLSNSILSQETTSHGFNWGDYDNDGKIDVVVCKPGGVNNLYRNLGNSNFVKVTNEIVGQEGGYSIGAAWTDINNNGKLDLFITNRNFTNYNYLYKNVGNIGNYLVCKLKGCESNKFGIGARIKIVKGDFVAYRDITSGGNWSQNMLAAHFGLGSNTALDSVIVYWPSNNITRLSNVSANQILTIEECVNSSIFFTKIVNDPISQTESSSLAAGWGDYNNDGYLDLVVTSFNDNCWSCDFPIQFYNNNGDGTFTRIYNNIIAQQFTKSSSIAWGDYNNDGWLDLFITGHLNSKNMLFRNNGNGNFTKITEGSIVNDIAWSQGAAWADYDNDGYIDLFVANRDNQPNFLYRNNGNGTFNKIISNPVSTDIGPSRNVAWGDYDNDGWIDLFVANMDNQEDFLYKNNGNGTFTKITNLPMVNNFLYSSSASWNDFDNNGYLDLLVTYVHTSTIFYNFGNANFQSQNTVFSNEEGSYGFAVADYDNDGYQDIFMSHNGFNNALYKNLNGSNFSKATNEIVSNEGGFSVTGAWGDINNNGKMDLIVTNVNGNHKNYFYKNVGPTGKYLSFRLIGCNSNRSGIGVKITVYKNSYKAMRVVNGGGAYSQNSLWPHFGLNNFNNVDSIVVNWPSGERQKFENLSTNQFLTVNECSGIVGIQNNINNIPSEYKLYQNYPNPFNPTTIIKFDVPNSSNIRLEVYDMSGRLVKTLLNEVKSAGTYEIEFNSNNLSSGTYFYQLTTSEFSSVKKMIILK